MLWNIVFWGSVIYVTIDLAGSIYLIRHMGGFRAVRNRIREQWRQDDAWDKAANCRE